LHSLTATAALVDYTSIRAPMFVSFVTPSVVCDSVSQPNILMKATIFNKAKEQQEC